jgi:hypothetical protein
MAKEDLLVLKAFLGQLVFKVQQVPAVKQVQQDPVEFLEVKV